jgi:hypothetical protein
MSDNPSKLSVPLLEEANYPTWRPAMEARLRQFGVFRIVTGETQEPSPPGLIPPTRCDAYSVRRVWSGRRRGENKRR